MKQPPRVIDPLDPLHGAVEHLTEGMSPEDRADKLIKMFGPKSASPGHTTQTAASEPQSKPQGTIFDRPMTPTEEGLLKHFGFD